MKHPILFALLRLLAVGLEDGFVLGTGQHDKLDFRSLV